MSFETRYSTKQRQKLFDLSRGCQKINDNDNLEWVWLGWSLGLQIPAPIELHEADSSTLRFVQSIFFFS